MPSMSIEGVQMSAIASVELHSVEFGAGVPVLAVHGWTPDHGLMLGCLEPVFAGRPGYRRLYPDLPAMGKTPAPEQIASSDDMLDALDGYVEAAVGSEPFLVVGESYGGYLARALVRRRRDQVLGLCLICSVSVQHELFDHERIVADRQVLRSEPGVLDGVDQRLADGFSNMAVVRTPVTLQRYRDEIQPGLDLADHGAMARIMRRWRLTDDPESGPSFDRPSLIMAGRQDNVVGYAGQFALLEHYPRATFAVLDVAGHNLQIEQPDLFDALIGEWLTRVVAG